MFKTVKFPIDVIPETGKYDISLSSAHLTTGIHGECLRKSFYFLTKEKECSDNTEQFSRKWFSLYLEDGLVNLLNANKLTVSKKPFLFSEKYKDIIITGRFPAIIMDYQNKNSALYPIFLWWPKGGKTLEIELEKKHIIKSLLVLDIHSNNIAIDNIKITYIIPHQNIFKEFTIGLDTNFPTINGKICYEFNVIDIYNRFIELHEYIKNGKVPPRDYRPEFSLDEVNRMYKDKRISKYYYGLFSHNGYGMDKECIYCKYRQLCLKFT